MAEGPRETDNRRGGSAHDEAQLAPPNSGPAFGEELEAVGRARRPFTPAIPTHRQKTQRDQRGP